MCTPLVCGMREPGLRAAEEQLEASMLAHQYYSRFTTALSVLKRLRLQNRVVFIMKLLVRRHYNVKIFLLTANTM